MEASKIFAERARLRLSELGWTHADLAKELGVSAARVSTVLTDNSSPRIDTLIKWAEAMKTTPQWLLGTDQDTAEERDRLACVAMIVAIDPGHLHIIKRLLKDFSSRTASKKAKSGPA